VNVDELHAAWDEGLMVGMITISPTPILVTRGTPSLSWMNIDVTRAVNDEPSNNFDTFVAQFGCTGDNASISTAIGDKLRRQVGVAAGW